METNRNTLIAIALSMLVLLGWQFLYVAPRMEAERRAAEAERRQTQQTQAATRPGEAAGSDVPAAGAANPSLVVPGDQAAPAQTRAQAVTASPRITIETPELSGSINLRGARFDDLQLLRYRVTVDADSPPVTLLSPSSLPEGYFAEFGFTGTDAGPLPGPDTQWTAPEGAKLTPQTPVTLTWTSPNGLRFERTISVDPLYMFTVRDSVTNTGTGEVRLQAYGRVTRYDKPETAGTYVLHEGPVGVLGEEGLQEWSYGAIEDDKLYKPENPVEGGWLGITDKYWAAAMVPQAAYAPSFSFRSDGRPRYQADYLGEPRAVAAGSTLAVEQLLFAGAKQVDVVDGYEASRNIKQFELLIDWGWFYFITKPMFYLLDTLFKLVGNFGVAILIATVLVKLLLFPLANLSYKSMAHMKKVQPELMALRERYPDDKVKQQQEMMAIYKRESINPAAGCWPVLVQIPIFFALYKVLFVTIEMRHAPFFGWIRDLAAPDPTSIFNLFGLLPYDVPPFLLIGVWPLIMGVTMFVQMQMNPQPPDPTQQLIFKWMPVVFTFMLATFPAGLVIYWAWNNTLSILQQAFIMRRYGAKIELGDNLRSLVRRRPTKPAE